ncbi:leucine-rich repeat domain-containing protein [Cryomorphaceae bacterium 1068]|nr:leucine-rich repeat domain-containing protein [Cryomorphaceae bacterium 1068]
MKTIQYLSFLFLLVPIMGISQDTTATFTSIEEALKTPNQVIRLDLSDQEIDFSLKSLREFKNMEFLSLRNDHLEQLPIEILELEQLRVLDLSGNDFTELPEEFFKLKNLEELYLNDEKRLNFTQSIDVLSKLPNLKILHLENDHISEFPENIFKLEKLENLYLNDNDLHEIPQSIQKMNQLKYLDIQRNPIPPSIQNTFNQNGNVLIRF